MLVSTFGPLPDVVGGDGRGEKLWEDNNGDEKNTSGTISGFTDDLMNDRTDDVDPKEAGPPEAGPVLLHSIQRNHNGTHERVLLHYLSSSPPDLLWWLANSFLMHYRYFPNWRADRQRFCYLAHFFSPC